MNYWTRMYCFFSLSPDFQQDLLQNQVWGQSNNDSSGMVFFGGDFPFISSALFGLVIWWPPVQWIHLLKVESPWTLHREKWMVFWRGPLRSYSSEDILPPRPNVSKTKHEIRKEGLNVILTSHRKNEGWKRPPFNLKKTALVKDLLIPIWYPGIVFRVVWQRGPANDAPECNFCLTWPSSWLALSLGGRPRHPTCEMREISGSVPCSGTALWTEKRPGPEQLIPGHPFCWARSLLRKLF